MKNTPSRIHHSGGESYDRGGRPLCGPADLDALADAAELRRPAPDGTEPRQMQPVPLAFILAEIRVFLRRFVAFPSAAYEVAVALWVVHTHVFDSFETTPYLAITSPVKRSGKSRLLEILELLAARAWTILTPSEAVVFRKIDRDRPTVLLDEVDAIYGPKSSSARRPPAGCSSRSAARSPTGRR